jgi:acyl-CoA reductase-like NAD-dependent aldehyde dehydrogenase
MTPETPNAVREWKYCLAGEFRESKTRYEVRCPWDDAVVGFAHRAGPAVLEQATRAAVAAFEATRALPSHRRKAVLRAVETGLTDRAEEFARILALEAGKPVKLARAEVQRAIFVFAQAAEEAHRLPGETLTLDAAPVGEGRQGLVRRFPVGPVAAVTPFNFPLMLVAHKLAPALAAGCPVVLKPASQTPLSALALAGLIVEAGWPAGGLSVLPLASSDAAPLVEDERFKLLTFTGSPAVGWDMKRRAGRKRVCLELGGNAAVIVHGDADLDLAASRLAMGGFAYAGQSCISAQRILVQKDVHDRFLSLFLPKVKALKVGPPLDETADLSSLIAPAEGARVAEWFDEARAAGARFLVGGGVSGGVVEPTVIAAASPDLRVNCREIFAPVVTVAPYGTFDEALAMVNTSDFGLQAGVFTNDLKRVWQAFEALEVGGVVVNDVSTWRVDHMPYGGVKHSGFGREGIRYAIEEMTEPRLLVLNLS